MIHDLFEIKKLFVLPDQGIPQMQSGGKGVEVVLNRSFLDEI